MSNKKYEYIGIELREQKLRELLEQANQIFEMSASGTIGVDYTPARPIDGKTDGFVTLQIPNSYVFKGEAKELFQKMIQSEFPDDPDDDFPADVELVVVHGADCTKLTFRVPDVWVWACAEDFSNE